MTKLENSPRLLALVIVILTVQILWTDVDKFDAIQRLIIRSSFDKRVKNVSFVNGNINQSLDSYQQVRHNNRDTPWQTLKVFKRSHLFFLHSYYDDRGQDKVVRLFLVNSNQSFKKIYCHFWSQKLEKPIVTEGKHRNLPWPSQKIFSEGVRYVAAEITCIFPNKTAGVDRFERVSVDTDNSSNVSNYSIF